mmetsp:Transcript_8309/g.20038  ORF Transcript_8309/g.20038 Transcript_8309/m.20038 type:complete len:138 (-) Transcript_8309:123-536(-)
MEQMVITPMVLSSRDDLTLQDIDEFINFFIHRDTEYTDAAPAQDGEDLETSKGQTCIVKNQYLSIGPPRSPGSAPPSSLPAVPPSRSLPASGHLDLLPSGLPKFDWTGNSPFNWYDLHGPDKSRKPSLPRTPTGSNT